jgi:flavin reductase (DIM6/NTAB) family NADH-FMN oxidoreductase RutF
MPDILRQKWTSFMDPQAKKEALRLFTYGLYAITSGDETRRNAFTANWVSQISFEPPLVALSVENTSTSLGIIRETGRFAINIFDATQRELAGRLGKGYVAHPDKLDGLTWDMGEAGCPTLRETLGWVECAVESETPAGDSTLLIGRVVGAQVLRPEEPLTMLAAGFRHAG